MALYQKKPVVVEAMRYPGCAFDQTWTHGQLRFREWLWKVSGNRNIEYWFDGVVKIVASKHGAREVLEANPGDWVIAEPDGMLNVCADNEFRQTYELAPAMDAAVANINPTNAFVSVDELPN